MRGSVLWILPPALISMIGNAWFLTASRGGGGLAQSEPVSMEIGTYESFVYHKLGVAQEYLCFIGEFSDGDSPFMLVW